MGHLNIDFSQPYAQLYWHLALNAELGEQNCGRLSVFLVSARIFIMFWTAELETLSVWRYFEYIHQHFQSEW